MRKLDQVDVADEERLAAERLTFTNGEHRSPLST
jgi:hypothetical protein